MSTRQRQTARKSVRDTAPRAWQRMLSGRRLDLLDPHAIDIEIDDIALGLSRVARWNGQTQGEHGFSVAQHSLIVEDICGHIDPKINVPHRLMALLHDAPEYVIGDMISPFKNALGLDYKRFEAHLEQAIHVRFGLPALMPAAVKRLIKQADHACAYFEATQLAGFGDTEARQYFGEPPDGYKLRLDPLPAKAASEAFLARFDALIRQMKA
ncbi:YfbR-like 5'-deoxynucleotidase [Asticcacaulis sp. AC402]|uniref:YfbR-like 5'-deoxynucleotidase n=1 Tax=Asticcacaulis sp. AC402 TaxID=1282361 RepID=UPI0003C3E4E3|nr:HD family hydrolase [Asticcacaulis sp. AC402]ESQ76440.1 phosphohydrolase [Asticcacaulis sp. AC402]